MQQKKSSPISKAAPNTEPTTIPAIVPPESPVSFRMAALLAEAEELGDEVEEGNSGGIEVKVGNVTPEQRLVTFDAMQHESVELGELVAQ